MCQNDFCSMLRLWSDWEQVITWLREQGDTILQSKIFDWGRIFWNCEENILRIKVELWELLGQLFPSQLSQLDPSSLSLPPPWNSFSNLKSNPGWKHGTVTLPTAKLQRRSPRFVIDWHIDLCWQELPFPLISDIFISWFQCFQKVETLLGKRRSFYPLLSHYRKLLVSWLFLCSCWSLTNVEPSTSQDSSSGKNIRLLVKTQLPILAAGMNGCLNYEMVFCFIRQYNVMTHIMSNNSIFIFGE